MDGKEDRIRKLAHEFGLEEGKPEGRAKEHWERAQRQVEADGTMPPEQVSTREISLPAQKKATGGRRVKPTPVASKKKNPSQPKAKRSTSSSADEST